MAWKNAHHIILGGKSNAFPLGLETKPGCQLSPLLFNILLEAPAIAKR
jgi:hypothetical protein